ncbi:hypothetical protein POM88_030088 [Heracleum sosnowskyi]|uniref:Uncharacterized protein n=1 Tax=Heracleum sosnowskyi TaxID=360622 RepID=A0AAD8HVC0_9APIA|nr:hypothetical protein POM88_030088 [Heracleum sosnowskyi]
MDDDEQLLAEEYVLLNSPEVQPYLRRYQNRVMRQRPETTPQDLDRIVKTRFKTWLKKKVENDEIEGPRFKDLLEGPSLRVMTFETCQLVIDEEEVEESLPDVSKIGDVVKSEPLEWDETFIADPKSPSREEAKTSINKNVQPSQDPKSPVPPERKDEIELKGLINVKCMRQRWIIPPRVLLEYEDGRKQQWPILIMMC